MALVRGLVDRLPGPESSEGDMGVTRVTRVGHPPLLGFGVESTSSGIGFPLIPQGAS